MSALTADQRWLLFYIGGWNMRECLLGPAYINDQPHQSMPDPEVSRHPDRTPDINRPGGGVTRLPHPRRVPNSTSPIPPKGNPCPPPTTP